MEGSPLPLPNPGPTGCDPPTPQSPLCPLTYSLALPLPHRGTTVLPPGCSSSDSHMLGSLQNKKVCSLFKMPEKMISFLLRSLPDPVMVLMSRPFSHRDTPLWGECRAPWHLGFQPTLACWVHASDPNTVDWSERPSICPEKVTGGGT